MKTWAVVGQEVILREREPRPRGRREGGERKGSGVLNEGRRPRSVGGWEEEGDESKSLAMLVVDSRAARAKALRIHIMRDGELTVGFTKSAAGTSLIGLYEALKRNRILVSLAWLQLVHSRDMP